MNTILDRMRTDGSSDARIGAAIKTTTTIAWATTLSHKPGVQRRCERVFNRASSNRIAMFCTELKCRSVQLPRRCLFGRL
jgi:hypothetical protein